MKNVTDVFFKINDSIDLHTEMRFSYYLLLHSDIETGD